MDRLQKHGRRALRLLAGIGLLAIGACAKTPEFSKIVVDYDAGWDIVRIFLPTQSSPRTEEIKYLHSPPRVRVTFNGRLDGLDTGTTPYPDPFLKSVQIGTASKGRIVITASLAASISQDVKARFYSSGKQRFYYIDIPRPARYRQELWTPLSLQRARRSGQPVVVVDAGHGGYDPGATSVYKKSLKEKQVNLDVSLEVDRILKRNKKVYPVLTRSGDYYPTLDERVDLVRRTGADLFVSVHADSTRRRSAKGFQIWIIDRSNKDVRNEARRLLKYGLRNQLATYSMQRQNRVLDLQEGFAIGETRRGAQLMEAALSRLRGVENRGVSVHPKNLRVLRHNFAPAFLIETGFLSNRQDTSRLSNQSKKDQMAAAIARGIESYFSQLKRRRVAPPLSPRFQFADRWEGSRIFSEKTLPYTVRRGDTLIGLARRHGVEKEDILIASGLPLSRRFLYIGEALEIPVPSRRRTVLREATPKKRTPRIVPESLEIGPGTLGLDRPALTEYVVRSDDNLLWIAHRHGTTARDLMKLNGWSEGRRLNIGDRLLVPDVGFDPARKALESLDRVWSDKPSAPRQPVKPSSSIEKEWGEYKVRPGDNLTSIAQKYSITVKELQAKNGLKNDLIRKGDILKVPFGKASLLEHEVDKGDTLEKISHTYGVPVDELRKLNNLRTDLIIAGDLLRVR